MDEQLASNPMDRVAWTIKASAHGDLGQWQSALKSIETAIKIDPRNPFSLIVYGRILLGLGLGFKAWDPLYEALKIEFKIPVAAMLMTSCGIARLEESLTPTQLKTLSDRRNFISSILQEFTDKEDFNGEVNVELLSLQMLISDGKFVEAIIFVRELEREQWLDRPDYWNWEIDNSIRRAGLSPSQVRFEAEKRQGDFFPNKPSA
jgi:tetratricopeptide (TPR) repeat protein